MITDTPRTDAAVLRYTGGEPVTFPAGLAFVVPLEFARQLERELAEAKAKLDEADSVMFGVATLKKLSAIDGGMRAELEIRPELAQWQAHCFANLVASSKNYSELHFETTDPESRQIISVTVKKENGKTPHEMRVDAERERDDLKVQLQVVKSNALGDAKLIEALGKSLTEITELASRMADYIASSGKGGSGRSGGLPSEFDAWMERKHCVTA